MKSLHPNRSLFIVFSTIALDAVGIGLVFPILPRLLGEVTHYPNIVLTVGVMTALYAAVQFLFAPVLGALSDIFGRCPVLLVSLAGAAVDYVFMACATQLWMLLLGRAVAGLTSANVSVSTAYLTDISPGEKRTRRFGFSNAMFGIGFIIGPVLGGFLGDYWVRLPFIAAAVLNAGNLLLTWFFLPESRMPVPGRIDFATLNPFRSLCWTFSLKGLLPTVSVFFILSAIGEAYGTCWALWGIDAFRWNGFWVGLSLGTFGVFQTLAQVFLPGPMVRRFGERWAVLVGIGCACSALVALALARQGWVVFAVMPLFALAGIGTPAFQDSATRQVGQDRQGQLQGVLTSTLSLASVVGPLVFSTFYFVVRNSWPGAIWLSVLMLYAIAVPLVFLGTRAGKGSIEVVVS